MSAEAITVKDFWDGSLQDVEVQLVRSAPVKEERPESPDSEPQSSEVRAQLRMLIRGVD